MSFRPNAFVLMLGSCLVFSSLSVAAQVIEVNAELNTDLMKTTYELVGPNARGGLTFGAVFVIGKPMKEDPTKVWVVLITAAHVLEEVVGDKATLMLHHENPDRTFSNDPFEFDIRDKGKNLYVRNPDADVAAMFIPLFQKSSKFDVLPMNVLVTDE